LPRLVSGVVAQLRIRALPPRHLRIEIPRTEVIEVRVRIELFPREQVVLSPVVIEIAPFVDPRLTEREVFVVLLDPAVPIRQELRALEVIGVEVEERRELFAFADLFVWGCPPPMRARRRSSSGYVGGRFRKRRLRALAPPSSGVRARPRTRGWEG